MSKIPVKISSHNVCRICRCATSSLVSLKCNCQGTIGFVHNNCLSKWTRVTGNDTCEICKGKYKCHVRDYRKMFRALLTRPYFTCIMRKVITCGLIIPLLYTNMKEIITTSNSPVLSYGIYYDTFLSPVLAFKVVLLYEFTVWSSKMLRDLKMIFCQWWNNNWSLEDDDNTASPDSSFESIQLHFLDLTGEFDP